MDGKQQEQGAVLRTNAWCSTARQFLAAYSYRVNK
jgi:hypothetical protein